MNEKLGQLEKSLIDFLCHILPEDTYTAGLEGHMRLTPFPEGPSKGTWFSSSGTSCTSHFDHRISLCFHLLK